MRWFVSEHLLSGAEGASDLSASMLAEGRSMLVALASDLARIGSHRVVTICHAAFDGVDIPGVEQVRVASADDEKRRFQSLAGLCDATFVIAPESAGILAARRRLVDAAGGRFIGCSLEAIHLCTDKLRLSEHCALHRLPQIPTAAFETMARIPRDGFPIVIKPRDGAGSQDTILVHSPDESTALGLQDDGRENRIWQPYLTGQPVSVAAVVHPLPGRADLFPTARQQISTNGRFTYLGGRIPFADDRRVELERLVRRTIDCIPGLRGYVGFDLIVPAENSRDVRLVEVNPRLTTSYLGYRALTDENLAARMLLDKAPRDVIHWKQQTVVFDTLGAVKYIPEDCVE